MSRASTADLRHGLSGMSLLAAAALSVLIATTASGLAASKSAHVPVPVPRPGSASPSVPEDDAIGALIAENPDESTATEDSDTAQVDDTDAIDPPIPSPAPPVVADAGPNSAGFELALKRLDADDPAGATMAAYALPDPIDVKIVDWLVANSGSKKVPSSRIKDISRELSNWPGQSLLRLRYEQAVANEKPSPAKVIKALGGLRLSSDAATLLLADAYVASGRQSDAAALIRAFWRNQDFSVSNEKKILSQFGDLLRPADHKARMDRLLYDEHSTEALRAAALLDKNQQALAKAVVDVIKGRRSALKTLNALPRAVRSDPLAIYSRIQVLRRADKTKEAAALLVSAPRDAKALVDPDAWWIERRLISRSLIEDGNAKLAYRVAAGHSAELATYRAEAEFHAGWYALEFLHDPAAARKHFAEIAAISTMPLSLSRAQYWLGRAAAAAGDKAEATARFRKAGAYPTTFYGQLALARLGHTHLGLSRPPAPDAGVRARFAGRELVKVIQRLTAAGRESRALIFYRHLADTLTDPAEIALLAAMADAAGEHQVALQIGKTAAVRGMPVETLAFPVAAIPANAKTPNVEKSLVYAVARQESAFNPGRNQPGRRARAPATHAGDRPPGRQVHWRALFEDAADRGPRLQRHPRRRAPRRSGRQLRRLLRHDRRRLQCRRQPRRRLGQAARRPARSEGRCGRLDRVDPVHRDAQLCPARHGKPAGLPGAPWRAGIDHRGRSEAGQGGELTPRRCRSISLAWPKDSSHRNRLTPAARAAHRRPLSSAKSPTARPTV